MTRTVRYTFGKRAARWISLTVAMVACTRDTAVTPSTLRIGWAQTPRSLEPPGVQLIATQDYLSLTFGRLTRISPTGILQPSIARSWKSFDARTWTFVLDTAARFHDGERITATHVVESWTHLAQSAGAIDWIPMLAGIEGAVAVAKGRAEHVTGLTVLDSITLRVQLVHPNGAFPTVISRAEYGIGKPARDHAPRVGSGDWRWARGTPTDSAIVLARVGSGPPFGVDSLLLQATPSGTAPEALSRRVVDCLPVAEPEDLAALWQNPSLIVSRGPTVAIARFELSGTHPALRDARVREAIAAGIDLPALIRTQGSTTSIPNGSRLPSSLAGAPLGRPLIAFAPQRARQLLQRAGATGAPLWLIVEPGLEAADTLSDVRYHVRNYLRAAGFSADIRYGVAASLVDQPVIVAKPVLRFVGTPDGVEFLAGLYVEGRSAALASPSLHAMFDSARALREPAAREQAARRLDALIAHEHLDVLMWHVPLIQVRQDYTIDCTILP